MSRIRRAVVIAAAAIAVLAPAAAAHQDHPGGDAPMELHGESAGHDPGGYRSGDPGRNGVDGTEPVAFVALLVAGVATVGAVAALIFGPRRVPA